MSRLRLFLQSRQGVIAVASLVAIAASLILSAVGAPETVRIAPLVVLVVVGGIPLVWEIVKDLIARTPGADLLAASPSSPPSSSTSGWWQPSSS